MNTRRLTAVGSGSNSYHVTCPCSISFTSGMRQLQYAETVLSVSSSFFCNRLLPAATVTIVGSFSCILHGHSSHPFNLSYRPRKKKLHCQKWRRYMARRLFPKPIHAKEEKNSPSSANQGLSTATTKCGLHVTQPTSSCPCSHRTHLQGTCQK